jgi:hypothetical protein
MNAVEVIIEKVEDVQERRFLRQAVSAGRRALVVTDAWLSLEIGWLSASLPETI